MKATPKRKTLTKKIRFEVFKRDKFTCQYCGRRAPDIVLEIDHIIPVASGGDNNIMNLIASCFDCNAGKKHRELNDDSALSKQRKQLDDLEERRSQIKMMLKWRNELDNMQTEIEKCLIDKIQVEYESQYTINDDGKKDIKSWLKKFTFNELCECTKISSMQYLIKKGECYTKESVEKFFNYIPRIASVRKQNSDNPSLKDIFYIIGIIKNRFTYSNDWQAKNILQQAINDGIDVDILKAIAKGSKNWTEWKNKTTNCIETS